jgi:putative phage-type endonuclease
MQTYAPKEINGATLLGTFEPDSKDWHDARAKGIGGSEVGTIMGLNQWESAFTLASKRLGLIETEPLTSMAVKLGKILEAPILDLFASEHPDLEVMTTGTYSRGYLHANPDALAKNQDGELIVVEVKTSRNYWSEVPPSYIAQVQHYLDVLDLNRAVIVSLVGMDYKEYWIDRDEFQIENQRFMVEQFWNGLQTGTLPDWDGSTSTYETVRALHPLINQGEEVEIDGAHYLVTAQLAYDEAEAELNKAKSQVMDAMGNAEHAYIEHEGERYRVASRRARGVSKPYLVIHKKGY